MPSSPTPGPQPSPDAHHNTGATGRSSKVTQTHYWVRIASLATAAVLGLGSTVATAAPAHADSPTFTVDSPGVDRRVYDGPGMDWPAVGQVSDGDPVRGYCSFNRSGETWIKIDGGYMKLRYLDGNSPIPPECSLPSDGVPPSAEPQAESNPRYEVNSSPAERADLLEGPGVDWPTVGSVRDGDWLTVWCTYERNGVLFNRVDNGAVAGFIQSSLMHDGTSGPVAPTCDLTEIGISAAPPPVSPAPTPSPTPGPSPTPPTTPTPSPEPTPPPEPIPPEPTPSPESSPPPGAGQSGPVDQLGLGETLPPGHELTSPNGTYRLAMQIDGNLVLYADDQSQWASDTTGNFGASAAMQPDGNLVISRPDGQPLWAAGTDHSGADKLAVQDDGNAVIYSPNGPKWSIRDATGQENGKGKRFFNGVVSLGAEFSGYNDGKKCATTRDKSDCAMAAVGFLPFGKALKVTKAAAEAAKLARAGKAAKNVLRAPQVLRVGDVKLAAVPKGAVGTPSQTGKGMQYAIPRGTPEISERVAGVRIMDPVTSGKYHYPNGYAAYMNSSGQTIDPLTGQTVADSHPFAHIPLP